MPITSDINSRFASKYLIEGKVYTRADLRQEIGTTDSTIEDIVFRPSGYNSVWLFITQQVYSVNITTQPNTTDALVWSGQLTRHNDQLIISHESRGLELLVFYRTSITDFPKGGFRYIGRFEYQRHTGGHPTIFTLARSGSMPSIAELQAQQDELTDFNPETIRDGREWVLNNIVRRRGQSAFRLGLLVAYSSTCAISDCKVEALLEAAHIIPYLGTITNHIQNGLLLRADIHTLFDLQLLAVDPENLTVLIAPSLMNSEYASLAGRHINMPVQPSFYPSREALRAHRIRCAF